MPALAAHALPGTAPAGDPASPVHRLDARAKLLGLIGVTVVAVSCAPGDWPVLAACAGALAAVAAVARVPARELWRRGRVVLLPVALVAALLPLVRADGGALAASVATQAAIGVAPAVLLTATTPFPAALRGLEALRVPPLLVQIAAFMYRYLFVLAGEGARMRQAL